MQSNKSGVGIKKGTGSRAKETKTLSLKELILAKDECLGQGYYWEHMSIKEKQPVEYQVFYSKLLQIAVNARELLRHVAGSVAVKEAGECVCGIYTPEGHAVVLSLGVLLHVYSMTELIRFMAFNGYEENPGIAEGDFYFNNDPHCGGQHAHDQFIITPVYSKGRLVAWVGGMSHELETGATGPGGYDPRGINRYYEGLILSPTKVATNDVLNNDFKVTVEHSTRDATIWLMDTQAKMSACVYMRRAIGEIIEEYGMDFYMEAIQEIIEDGRRAALKKIQSRFLPGVYRSRAFIDTFVPDREPKCLQVNMKMTVEKDGHLNIDLEGCSREGPYTCNGTAPATRATFYCALAQILMYDCKFGAGSYFAVQSRIPQGSVFSCSLPAATSRYIQMPGAGLVGTMFDAVSRMYYASGYLEEVCAATTGSLSMGTFGQDDRTGRNIMWFYVGVAAGGSGGRALMDGIHTHYMFFNPEGDTADAEIWDRTSGAKMIGRRHRADSGGFGKYRGGCSLDEMSMIYHGKNLEFNAGGANYHVATNQGLMGGYPTPPAQLSIAFDTNLEEVMAQGKPYPVAFGSPDAPEISKYVKGRLQIHAPTAYPNTEIKNFDIVELSRGGGAGFGDPLERDPESIVKDLVEGTTTFETTRNVYGVVIRRTGPLARDLECDQKETAEIRSRMRSDRGKKAVPYKQYKAAQKDRLVKGDIPRVCALMINELLGFSAEWAKNFRKEWGLPDNFESVPLNTEAKDFRWEAK